MLAPLDKGIAPTQEPITTCPGTRPNTGVCAVGRKSMVARWQRQIGALRRPRGGNTQKKALPAIGRLILNKGDRAARGGPAASCLEPALGGHQGQPQPEAEQDAQRTAVSFGRPAETVRRTSSQWAS